MSIESQRHATGMNGAHATQIQMTIRATFFKGNSQELASAPAASRREITQDPGFGQFVPVLHLSVDVHRVRILIFAFGTSLTQKRKGFRRRRSRHCRLFRSSGASCLPLRLGVFA
jgi:hypothetical protein